MAAIPTIRIVHDEVPTGIVINAVDFDPALHTKFGEPEKPRRGRPPNAERAQDDS